MVHTLISNGSLGDVMMALSVDPHKLNHKRGLLEYPLGTAIKHKKQNVINFLLKKNLSQNHINSTLMYLLTEPTLGMQYKTNMIRKLINRGAHVNTKVLAPWTPLSYLATRGEYPHIVNELIKKGAKPTRLAVRSASTGPITMAKLNILKTLVKYGAPVNQALINGITNNQARNAVMEGVTLRNKKAAVLAALVDPTRNRGRSRQEVPTVSLNPHMYREILRLAGLQN